MRDLIREYLLEMRKRFTNSEFIDRALEVHGNKYFYDKIDYKNAHKPIIITCPIHGDFSQSPDSHLRGSGCPQCGKEIKVNKLRSTTNQFIDKSKKIHGDKYDYGKTEYVKNSLPVIITCSKHGDFSQPPIAHLVGKGCPKCANEERGRPRSNTDEFINKAKQVHGDKYSYGETEYKKNNEYVIISCPIHGNFLQSPAKHLIGRGCPKCADTSRIISRTSNTQEFIDKARKVHGDKYSYDKTDYKKVEQPITITCLEHGNFLQSPAKHLMGRGCPECSRESRIFKRTSNTDDFIDKAKKVHGDKYSYDKVEYKNAKKPVTVTCLKPNHGDFPITPDNHLRGKGCPKCSESKGEILISKILNSNGIQFTPQKKFNDCTNRLEGKSCRQLKFDFYLPDFNTIIEYDGEGHFEPFRYTGGEKGFQKVQKYDEYKNQYCINNSIQMIRIPYTMKKNLIEPFILKKLNKG